MGFLTGIRGRFALRALVFTGGLLCASGCWADMAQKACVPKPGTTNISYGELVSCEINPVGDSNFFKFTGQAGDYVRFNLFRYTGGADHCFRLIDPDGVFGNYNCVNGLYRPSTLSVEKSLTKSGEYTIQVIDGSNDETFTYGLIVWRFWPLPTTTGVAYGIPVEGSNGPRGDIDFFSFFGSAGDTVNITLTRLTGGADQCYFFIDPDGTVNSGSTSCVNGLYRPTSLSNDVKLTKTGAFTMAVLDGSQDETFTYRITMQCFGVCPAGPITGGPQCPASPTYQLSPASQLFPASGGTGAIGVITQAGCPWTSSSTASHITINSGSAGVGSGTIQYTVANNSATSSRSGTITSGGQTATITQSGTSGMLIASPASLAFRTQSGGSAPPEQILSINSTGTPAFTAGATSTGGNWLSVKPANGTAPASVVVSVNPAGVASGTYQGSITVTAPNANPSTISVGVTLTIDAPPPASLDVPVSPLIFSFARGALGRTEQRVVSNVGSGTLNFTASATSDGGGSWLRVSPANGQATQLNATLISITADPGGLTPGTYTGQVSVTGAGATKNIPVTLTVSAIDQTILLSQTGLTFVAVANGGTVPPQTFGILNTGKGVMDWAVKASAAVASQSWLSVTPSSGSTDASSLQVPLVSVQLNPAGLSPGEYYGQVAVTAGSADNTPQVVSVLLSVLPAGSDPGPVVRPTGLIFTGVAGAGAPAAQSILVSNLSATARTLTAGKLTTDGANWFAVQPATTAVQPNQPVSVAVTVNPSGLAAGIRRGVLTLLFQDGSVRTVNILFVLSAGGANEPKSGTTAGASCLPTQLLPLITTLGTDFTVPAGWPNAVEVRVVDDCGAPLADGSVVATFSNGDPPLALVSLKNGTWSRTWTSRNASVAQVTVKVDAENAQATIKGAAQVTGGLRTGLVPPAIKPGGVVSAASYAANAPIPPGGMVSIFGSGLAQGTDSSKKLPLEMQLSGTLATLGGKTMPLLFTSDGQVNAMVPFGLPVNTQHQMVVRRGDTYTVPEPVTVAAAGPAIFSKDMTGKGQGLIVSSSSGKYAEPGTATKTGDVLVIYCTGLGDVTPPVETGAATPVSPLSWAANGVKVTIGGVEAKVWFAGLVPNYAGFYQVNAEVPPGVAPGNQVPVVLTVAGQSSAPVTIAVAAAN
jgi:uncharacterized protein (TIGR03437 family)